jgi:hypothetical protein
MPVVLIVATAALPLVHEPPDTDGLSTLVAPLHNASVPVIAPAVALTVTTIVA